MISNFSWYEWICHSNFSFCTGASHPEEYVTEAHLLAYKGLGICDYNGIYGIVRAYRQQLQIAHPPKLFYGTELNLAADHTQPIPYRDSIILYALNRKGYHALCQIISLAHQNSKNQAYLSLDELLKTPSQDLICIQPMRGFIRKEPLNKVFTRYALLQEHYSNNFFPIISRHLNPLEDHWIKVTQEIAKKIKAPILFSQDTYFHNEERKYLCDVLQAIRLNKQIDHIAPHLFVNSERSFRSLDILSKRYSCFSDANLIMKNSHVLAEKFDFSLKELCYHYPQEFIPAGYNSFSYLEEVTWTKAMDRYHDHIPSKIKSLLRRELGLVKELEFADYFLTVWDIVCWARSQKILCQGRGSAANSAICFVLGITAVNPSEFDVLFERFISKERGDPPDIDIDFEHERREEVIQYIYQRYGRQRAAMVANVISFRRRSALRCVGKALGIDESNLNELGESSTESYQTITPVSRNLISSDRNLIDTNHSNQEFLWNLWRSLAATLTGFPHHMGIHSGGFIITQEKIESFCAQEPATMEGRTVIQWAKDDIEFLNFFKIDILALGMLTVIRKTLEIISHNHTIPIRLEDIPPEDPATYAMIQKAETVGTFQIESRAQMALLPRLRPQTFYDLVLQIGIIRPGPIQGGLIHPYLKRRNGLEPVVYPDPRLEPILKRTLGIPIFQEQIMRIAITIGDFSPGEADQLRKHIGAWSLHKEWGPMVKRLEEGMIRNGVQNHLVKKMLSYLEGFANYGFPESHAVSFALLAYTSAYLKCHYKEAFYTSLINSQPVGFYSIHALVQNARREDCLFLPIDLCSSDWNTKFEQHTLPDGEVFSFIRLGLHLIKGFSQKTANIILEQRKQKGTWASLASLLTHIPIPSHELAALAAANALQSFGLQRPQAIWLVAAGIPATFFDEENPYPFDEESALNSAKRDFEHFGTTLDQHPCKIIREHCWMYPINTQQISRAIDLASMPRRKVHIFGLLLMRQQPQTAKGMVFLTLEDESGLINVAVTPDKAKSFFNELQNKALLCLSGTLQKHGDSHSIMLEKLHSVSLKEKNIIPIRNKNKKFGQHMPLPSDSIDRSSVTKVNGTINTFSSKNHIKI